LWLNHLKLPENEQRLTWRRKAIEIAQNGLGDPPSRGQGEFRLGFLPQALPEARFASAARPVSAFLGRRQARL
jgi:hypothetical protein